MLEVKNLTAIRDERILFESLSFEIHAGELVQIEVVMAQQNDLVTYYCGSWRVWVWGNPLATEQNSKWPRKLSSRLAVFRSSNRHQARTHRTGKFTFLSGGSSTNGGWTRDFSSASQSWISWAWRCAGCTVVGRATASSCLARLWLSKKPLWILDEPLTAIDKQGVSVLEALFLSHAQQGGIVILTTHQDMFADNPKLRKIRLGDPKWCLLLFSLFIVNF